MPPARPPVVDLPRAMAAWCRLAPLSALDMLSSSRVLPLAADASWSASASAALPLAASRRALAVSPMRRIRWLSALAVRASRDLLAALAVSRATRARTLLTALPASDPPSARDRDLLGTAGAAALAVSRRPPVAPAAAPMRLSSLSRMSVAVSAPPSGGTGPRARAESGLARPSLDSGATRRPGVMVVPTAPAYCDHPALRERAPGCTVPGCRRRDAELARRPACAPAPAPAPAAASAANPRLAPPRAPRLAERRA
mmetsp:Transcript_6060/g.25337  ORF Transcript_6060/g.25337 Transcript_6060/m.25337 type:complete len:256 (-) Transcript_6060:188-955(-)